MVCIYKITSPSGKIYIGQTWNSSKRFSNYRKGKCQSQPALNNSFKKYGADSHDIEVIHELPSDIDQTIIDSYEILYILQYKECGYQLLNIREGGSRGKHSKESIQKIKDNMPEKCLLILKEYNSREDRYKRPKGFFKDKRHPREYKVKQIDQQGNTKIWDSIKEIYNNIGYNKQMLQRAVKGNFKYKNSYWEKYQ